ncbi:MAG: PAS domain S-box protein [Anaerolineales bacterium]|nr:PAS domain S-box protein [Anaerolineales bacterium]
MGHKSSAQPDPFSHSAYLKEIAQALYTAAEQAIFLVGADGRILEANAAAHALADGEAEQLLGRLAAEFLPQDGRFQDLNGRSHAITLTTRPLENGRQLFMVTPMPESKVNHSPLAHGVDARADVLANSPYGFDIVSAEGTFLYANQTYLKMWGYDSLEEILGTSPAGHCADPDMPVQIISNLEAHGEYTVQFTALRKDGSTFEVLMSTQKVVDSQGRVTYEGSSIDVSELLQGRQKLILERRQMRVLLDAIPDLIWLKDVKGVYQACNPEFEKLVGMPEAELLGKTDFDFFPEEAAKAYLARDQVVINSGQPDSIEEWATFASDGRTILAETIKTPIYDDDGKLLGVLGIARDITARHYAREALRQSEANLRAIFNNTLQAFLLVDCEQRVLAMNSVAVGLMEKLAERPLQAGEHVADLFSQLQLDGFGDVFFEQALQGDSSSHEMKVAVPGGHYWLEIHVSPVVTDESEITGASLSILDITDRKTTEMALHESEARLFGMLDSAMDAIVSLDDAQEIVLFNAAAQRMFGYTAEEAVGKSHDILLPERFRENHRELVIQFGETGESTLNMGQRRALVGRRANGEEFPVEVSISRVKVGEKTLYTAILRDVTQRKATESALQESEERLRLFIDHAPAALAMFDQEMRYLAVSHRWLTDFDIENVIGRSHYDTFPEIPDRWKAVHERSMAGEVVKANEDKFVRQDGRIQWLRWEVRPWYTGNNVVGGIVIFSEDITQRKNAEEAVKDLQEILSEAEAVAKIGSWRWDLATRKVTWSDQMYALFDMEPDDFDGDLNAIITSRIHPDDVEAVNQSNLSVLERHEPVPLEYRIVLPDGTVRTVWAEGRLLHEESAKPTAMIGYVQDITDRKAAEQALRDSEERYHTSLDSMLEGCQIISFDWRYLYLNESVTKSSRRHKEDLLGRTMMEAFPGIENTELFTVLRRCMTERTSQIFENKFVYEDGSHAWFDLSVQPVPEGLFILSIDTTERRQVEEALRQSEERFSKAFQLSPAALSLTRADGRLVDVNESYERLSGYAREELIGHDATEFGIFTQAQREDLRQRMMEQGGSLHEAEIEVHNKTGELRHVLYSVEAIEIGNENYALTLAFDITDRKQLENQLKEMADNMATAQAITHSGSWELRVMPDGRYIEPHIWSDECYRVFGLEPGSEPITAEKFYSMVHPDDLPEVKAVFTKAIAEGQEASGEYRLIWPDGSIHTVFDQVKPMVDERTGRLQKVVGLVRDITDGKQAEITIKQLNRRMELILNSAGEGIYGTDIDGRITFINPAMVQMLGWPLEELLGQDAHAMFHHSYPDGTPYPTEACEISISVEKGAAFRNAEDTYWRRDGQPILVDYACTPIRENGNILGSVMVVRDITESKLAAEQQMILEEQLRQAQKMESIGRLAGGVAHDFNNQLAVIKLYGDLMRYQMAKEDPLLPKVEQIRQAVDRATHLTRQLLAFSRKQVLQPVVLDMNELITNLEKMLGRLIGEDINLSTDLQPGLWPIAADPGQLEQVIMNLVINARDAMTTGGMLTIETRNLIHDETTLAIHPDALPGPVVMLAITDTGQGMDEETRQQIFEPFFTTKGPGKGTGLGLATVHGIIKQSGGAIYVYSELGHGTTFKIYLPVSEEVAPDMADVSQTAVPQSGHETILLVEDEEALRDLVRLTLEEIGYTILEAEDGIAALALAAEHSEPIHMLLTDVVLPQKGGRKLAEELTAQRPGIRVLFMSGYMDDAVMRHGVLMAEMNFLSKPFSRSALASKVRDVLDKPLS